jgi:two-component system, NarL family, nitrate/nitrite response regulator NarL
LIVDDHRLFAEAIKLTLEESGHEVLLAATGSEALEAARRDRPEVVLMDVGLPDRSGLAVGRDILAELPGIKMVVVTSLEDDQAVREAVRSRFHGYLTKHTRLSQFVGAVETAVNGQMVLPQGSVTRRALSRGDQEAELLARQLTPKELEVLRLLAEGANSSEIARTLTISPNTVRTHVQSILAKLQVHSRLEAVAFAARNGLVTRGQQREAWAADAVRSA